MAELLSLGLAPEYNFLVGLVIGAVVVVLWLAACALRCPQGLRTMALTVMLSGGIGYITGLFIAAGRFTIACAVAASIIGLIIGWQIERARVDLENQMGQSPYAPQQ